MKTIVALMTGMVFSLSCLAQEVVHRTFFSQALKDSIRYDVWLPRDWNINGHYPSVYMNSYGALGGGNGMLVAANLNNFINQFPSSIVIDIQSGQMDKMGYSYTTGEVNTTGLRFIASLEHELIPQIEANYKATRFRAFIGHSFSSSYANYLFLHKPGLFNAYLLFTPEKIDREQPPFTIDD